jgi:hypothetical protein
MDVHIKNVVGHVRAIDGESLLSPQTMEQIVRAVLSAIDERELRTQRAQADTKVTSGVAAEEERSR